MCTRCMECRSRLQPLIRWAFERDQHYVTCGVSMSPDGPFYEVATTPLWSPEDLVVERFDTPIGAMQRHAAIVESLRDAGWTLSAYSDA